MRDRTHTVLSDILPPEERVIEAVVARYQRVAPAVTRFARTLSKNEDLRVRLGSEAASRPGEVVLDPRLFQAAYSRSAPVTPAEVALASALHEVVHLAVTDFEEQRPIPTEWLPEDHEEIEEEPVPLLDALAEAGGPAAEALFLALEDARQEIAHLSAYRGAQSVLEDMYVAATPGALAHARPLGQFALACFLIVGEYSERDRLQKQVEPHVAAALDDAMVFLDGVRESTDVWEVAGRALQLLQVARLHGLLTEVSGTQMIGDHEQASENDRDAIAEGVDQVRLTSPILQDVESYDETMEATAGRLRQRGRFRSRRRSLDRTAHPGFGGAARLSPDRPGRQIGGRPVPRAVPAVRRWKGGNPSREPPAPGAWPSATSPANCGRSSSPTSGAASAPATTQATSLPMPRSSSAPASTSACSSGAPSRAAGPMRSASSSTDRPRCCSPAGLPGGSRAPWGMAAATLGAWTLARLADELQVEFEMALFNRSFAAAHDDTEATYIKRMHGAAAGLRRTQGSHAERLTRTVNHYLLKTFDQRWRSAEDVVAGLFWTAAEPRASSGSGGPQPG